MGVVAERLFRRHSTTTESDFAVRFDFGSTCVDKADLPLDNKRPVFSLGDFYRLAHVAPAAPLSFYLTGECPNLLAR